MGLPGDDRLTPDAATLPVTKEGVMSTQGLRPAVAEDDRTGVRIAVRLGRHLSVPGYPHSGQPFVEIVVSFPDWGPEHPTEEVPVYLSVEFARAVGWMLISAAREASR
jgi:hypothetical protein